SNLYGEYKNTVERPPGPAVPIPVRRAVKRLSEAVETRIIVWEWGYALAPDGLQQIRERLQAHEERLKYPLLDAVLSCRLHTVAKRHELADRLATEAEMLGIKPTMSPKDGKDAIRDRHRVWFLTPALAMVPPILSLEDHNDLCELVDDLHRQIRRLDSPRSLAE